jgi:phosphate-selective porin OprO/OprP
MRTDWSPKIAAGAAVAILFVSTSSLRGAEAEEAKPKPPVISAGDRGLSLESGDGTFQLRLRTLLQSDTRFYFKDGESSKPPDDFLMRRARLELTGKLFGQFDFRLMPDFAPAAHTLLDAWLRWTLSPAVQIQAGKVKLPVGLEREQTREFNLLTEFGYPTSLVPNRDVGLNLQGQVMEGALSYYVGAFNGTADGQSVVSDTDDGKSAAARIFATPTGGALKGLGLGVAATHGEQEGLPAVYRTVGQQIFYRWHSDVVTDGTVSRLVPQAYYFRGPFGALAEYAVSSQEIVQPIAGRDELESSAWQVTASWVLTGEESTFRGVKPRRNVDVTGDGWGAWQIVARVTELDVDDDAFPRFADPLVSASKATSYGVGLNWYLNPQVRFLADYNLTELDGSGTARFDDEKALITRVQLRF